MFSIFRDGSAGRRGGRGGGGRGTVRGGYGRQPGSNANAAVRERPGQCQQPGLRRLPRQRSPQLAGDPRRCAPLGYRHPLTNIDVGARELSETRTFISTPRLCIQPLKGCPPSHAAGLEGSLSPSPMRRSREGGTAFRTPDNLTADLPSSPPITPSSSEQNGPTPPPHARGSAPRSSSAEILQSARYDRDPCQDLLPYPSANFITETEMQAAPEFALTCISVISSGCRGQAAVGPMETARFIHLLRSTCGMAPCPLHWKSCQVTALGMKTLCSTSVSKPVPALLVYSLQRLQHFWQAHIQQNVVFFGSTQWLLMLPILLVMPSDHFNR